MTILFTILFAFLPPCAQEDSTNCAWDAKSAGNGEGHSFIALDLGDRDFLIYDDGRTDTYPH